MYENNTGRDESLRPTPEVIEGARQELMPAYVADLEAKIAELEKDRDYWVSRTGEKVAIIENARIAIEEVLAGDVDPATTFEEFREAFELLGVKATREVSIEISVSWRGTIELPIGVEVDDLDIDDFDVRGPNHNEYDCNLDYYGMHDYSINER